VRDLEREAGRHGAINEPQYTHLKMLERWDEEEKERFQAEKGTTVEEYVITMLGKLLNCDKDAAKEKLEQSPVNSCRFL
jgi:hypothetical protein